MTPQSRRRLIPILVLFAATGVLLAIIFGSKRANNSLEQSETPSTIVAQADLSVDEQIEPTPTAPSPNTQAVPSNTPNIENSAETLIAPFEVLLIQQHEHSNKSLILGALDDIDSWQMEVQFTQTGAACFNSILRHL